MAAGAPQVPPSAVFSALGDPVRLRLLAELGAGERSAGALVDAARAAGEISQPAVSRHLRVLREAELVTVRPEGTQRVYALDEGTVRAARDVLSGLLDPAGGVDRALGRAFDALATEVARGRRARRAPVGEQGPTRPGQSSGAV